MRKRYHQLYMPIFLALLFLLWFSKLVAFADETSSAVSNQAGSSGLTSSARTDSAAPAAISAVPGSGTSSATDANAANANAATANAANANAGNANAANAAGADSTAPPLRDYINGVSSQTQDDGSVASFFQVPPNQRLQKNEIIERSKLKTRTWHILDNLGVPMFCYQGDDLDPSISRSARLPSSTADSTLSTRDGQPASSMRESGYTTVKINKIPESELDGVELPSLRDAHGKD